MAISKERAAELYGKYQYETGSLKVKSTRPEQEGIMKPYLHFEGVWYVYRKYDSPGIVDGPTRSGFVAMDLETGEIKGWE